MLPFSEQYTRHFYKWEKRGRGWQVFPYPVDPEPQFVPFFFDFPEPVYSDDGKEPTLLSSLARYVRNVFSDVPQENDVTVSEDESAEAYPFKQDREIMAFGISLPRNVKVRMEAMEQLLLMLSFSQSPISFEIVAGHEFIRLQFVCSSTDAFHVQNQVKAFFPEAVVKEDKKFLDHLLQEKPIYMFDFGLREEFLRPLQMADNKEPDHYTGLFGVFDNLEEGEQAVIQVLFKGTVNSWAESIIQSVSDGSGGCFFADAPEMILMAKEKVSSPLFGVVIRAIGQAETNEAAQAVLVRTTNALIHLTKSDYNRLIPLTVDNYSEDSRIDDTYFRESHRLGMLLNCRELATLVHFPGASVVSEKLIRDAKKTKAAPAITEGHPFLLGSNFHRGKEKTVTLSSTQRLKHMHVIGATGTGKSTFLHRSIVQDIQAGTGVAVLDPHGDLIEAILPHIPLGRVKDVIIFDPADSEYPVGFNILSAHSEIEKDILSSDLVASFKRLSTSWGDQMNSVFANAILAFLESTKGGTLADLRRFLIEKPFREVFLQSVTDPNVVYYWQKEFPLLKSGSVGPILTRLDTFLRPKLIRNMVAQKRSLDFENILNSQKILLVKLSQGQIGAENSYLLGTFVVSKIHQAAMARQALNKSGRSDFYMYIDEFQNFITPSMSSILSGARKYHLGLILAHQDMQQLTKQDSELASSVISNAGTRICFRLGDIDAKKFEDGFASFGAQDLQNLGLGEAIARVDRPEYDFSLETTPLPEAVAGAEYVSAIINHSRQTYGTPKTEVENTLAEEYGQKVQVPHPGHLPSKTKEPTAPLKEPPVVKEIIPDHKAKEAREEDNQHRYLQMLIKRMAESRGFKAGIEEPVPDGDGRIDVVLERNNIKIACEVTVTTGADWEMHNIAKCLKAGFGTVVVVSNQKGNLEKIKKLLPSKFSTADQKKILVLRPEELFMFLDRQIAQEAGGESRMKGYRVKVEYTAAEQDAANRKKDSIAKVIADSIKKNRKG